jgi:glycosyltransferase involved in cell wall biosynthesis
MRPVSVIVPAYNGAAFVGDTLDSIFAQTSPPDEVLVIDDGSTDGTDQVVAHHPRAGAIRLLRQANGGAASARNTGIEAARHEWIAFLDADDRWLPRWLELGRKLLDLHPDLLWVAGAKREIPLERPPRIQGLAPEGRRHLRDGCWFENVFTVFGQHCIVLPSGMLVHRQCLDEVGGFDTAMKRREDVDLWTRVGIRHPRLGWIDEPVFEYVHRPGSLTRTLPEMSALDMVRLLQRRAREHPGGESLCGPYGRYMARQGCKTWLHTDGQEDLRQALREFPDWLPARWMPWLRFLAALPPTAFHALAWVLKVRLRLLHRDRRSRATRAHQESA